MEDNIYLNKQEFVENNAKRIPVCIVVDCSGSMKEYDGTDFSRIERVNRGISYFYDGIRNNSKTRKAVDVLIIQVGNSAKIISDFANTEKNPSELKYLAEKNNLTEGLELALKKLDERKKIYRLANIDYYQPWLLIMSDGDVNVGYKRNFVEIQNEIKNREENYKLSVFPIFIQREPYFDSNKNKWSLSSKTYKYRLKLMTNFSNDPKRLIKIEVADSKSFEELFCFLHKSASSVASAKGFINDPKYGNYNQIYKKVEFTNNQLYYDDDSSDFSVFTNDNISEMNLNEINDNILDDELKKINDEELKRKNDLELIEKAKKELAENKEDLNENDQTQEKKVTFSIDTFINGIKSYPIKKYDEKNLILVISINANDRVTIKKDISIIYDKSFESDGRFQFIIDENLQVNVTKIEVQKQYNMKIRSIENMNDEIEKIVDSISDWDNI